MALTLPQLQSLIRDTYGAKDGRRGVEGTFMWFMEEVGELSAALRGGRPGGDRRRVRRRAGLAGNAGQHRWRRSGRGSPGKIRRRLPRMRTKPLQMLIVGETMTSEQNRRGMTAGRRLSSVIVVCSLFAVACSRCAAESPPHIEQVRIGLPGGQAEQESARSRYGAWAPVYVKLKAGPEGSAARPLPHPRRDHRQRKHRVSLRYEPAGPRPQPGLPRRRLHPSRSRRQRLQDSTPDRLRSKRRP